MFSILMAETSRCYAVASYSTNSNPIIKLVRTFLPALIRILYSKTGVGRWAGVWGLAGSLDFLRSTEITRNLPHDGITDAQTLSCMS